MNTLTNEGKYEAVVVDDETSGLIEIGDKKSPAVRLILAVTDEGAEKGRTIEWIGWLTENALESTVLRLSGVFGFSGEFSDIAENPNLFAGLPCHIEAGNETYEGRTRLKVKWLNPPGGGGNAARPLDKDAAKKLAASLSHRARALLKSAAVPAPAPARPTAATTGAAAAARADRDEFPF